MHIFVEVDLSEHRRIEDQPNPDQLQRIVLLLEAVYDGDDAEQLVGADLGRTIGDARVVAACGVIGVTGHDAAGLQAKRDHMSTLRPDDDGYFIAFGELGEGFFASADFEPLGPQVFERRGLATAAHQSTAAQQSADEHQQNKKAALRMRARVRQNPQPSPRGPWTCDILWPSGSQRHHSLWFFHDCGGLRCRQLSFEPRCHCRCHRRCHRGADRDGQMHCSAGLPSANRVKANPS